MSRTDTGSAVGTSPGAGGAPPSAPTPTPRRRFRWLLLAVPLVLAALVGGLIASRERTQSAQPTVSTAPTASTEPSTSAAPPVSPAPTGSTAPTSVPPSKNQARLLLGEPPSKQLWFSGAWAGGGKTGTARLDGFGSWRGTPVDAATVYPQTTTWQTIHDSGWAPAAFDGFKGVLAYGLPILPDEDGGDFASVVSGEHDWVYQQVATDLVAHGRGTSIVRVGWEGNGDWFPWNATADTADEYVAAYRHVVGVLHRTAPDLVIDFDLGCGTPLRGQQDRQDALRLLYPGDDVVDLVGCDFYDWHNTKSTDEASWQQSIRPTDSVGIQDVADFARAHGKGLTYPEWGLAGPSSAGVGDNPFFIQKTRSFFEANADILVLESYFSEPVTTLQNSLWDPAQMPSSAELYRQLW